MTNFKIKRLDDRKWLGHIRNEMHCVITGSPNPDPAHIRYGADGGTGIKPSDYFVLPLSPALHNQQHSIGEPKFYKTYFPRMTDDTVMFFIRCGAKELHRLYKNEELAENFFMR